jgi:hypothetical protein
MDVAREIQGLAYPRIKTLMNIRFTSSLTPEDENSIAPVLIKAVAAFLDLLPIAYVIRIDTSDSTVLQHSSPQSPSPTSPSAKTSATKSSLWSDLI